MTCIVGYVFVRIHTIGLVSTRYTYLQKAYWYKADNAVVDLRPTLTVIFLNDCCCYHEPFQLLLVIDYIYQLVVVLLRQLASLNI